MQYITYICSILHIQTLVNTFSLFFKAVCIDTAPFLDDAKTEKAIADQTLAALTIMIAESQPSEKEMMINVIMNCMVSE